MIKLIDLLRESQGVLGNYTPYSFPPDLTSLNKEEHATVMNDLRKERMGLMDYISFIHSMIGYDPIYKVIFSKLFRANKKKIDFLLDQSDILKDKETPDSIKLQKFKSFYEKYKDDFPNWALKNEKLYQDISQILLPSLNERECWDGYKPGTPKTKISSKTGKRVNNCVPIKELVTYTKVICDDCGWKWDIAKGGKDLYICHECGHNNTPK